ncbi:MAG: right-handed parallel beta-helix repeat-containing protein [Candidatus Thorarchaeota archaeon]
MMEENKIPKTVSLVIISMLLFIPGMVLIGHQNLPPEIGEPVREFVMSQYITHSSISINNDTEFQNEGFSGSGTSEDPFIIENIFFNSTFFNAVDIVNTRAYFIIRGCKILAEGMGIYLFNVSNGLIEDCIIQGNGSGIYVDNSTNMIIDDCEFLLSYIGIEEYGSSNSTIRDSKFHHNDWGIYLESTYDTRIQSCTIYSNLRGIQLDEETYNITVFSNSLCWNGNHVGGFLQTHDNARDQSENNTWTSNRWSDYVGTGVYILPGGTGTQDLFASRMVDIDFPVVYGLEDIRYDEGAVGNWLNWNATDPLPAYLNVYIDDDLFELQTWTSENYRLLVDGFPIGSHNITIQYIDAAGNTAIDQVWVSVMISIFGGEGTEYVLYASLGSIVCVMILLFAIKRMR